MDNKNELYITDLVEVETLQKIQDTFSRMTGMSAITIDLEGKPVTNASTFSEFCLKYTRASKLGLERCRKCNLDGARMSLEAGMAVIHKCHAGLLNFSAPILAEGKMVGSIAAGQVSTRPLSDEAVSKTAEELGINEDEYINAAGVIPIVDETDINRSAEFLYSLADIFSELAYHKYLAIQAGVEIQRAADMKGDFLANMSHEIRTPMNAVIGMAEMALREDLPAHAREYINQIKTSGSSLLTIINDILDFSKIEAGKMDIVWVEYEPLSLINDVVNILTTRLKDKDIELVVDVDINLPKMLFGDENRIKQVIINLSNNAVKFTKSGMVALRISCSQVKDKQTVFSCSVEDTGIGIKKEDMSKLFQSFQQLDSKRNRNIEGNGLGLAISSKLLSLMNGSRINVESVYDKGSTFSFNLPQMVLDEAPSIELGDLNNCLIINEIKNPYISYQLSKDAQTMGVPVIKPLSQKEMDDIITDKDKSIYYFMEKEAYNEISKGYILARPDVHVIILVPFVDTDSYDDVPNIMTVKKPLYSFNLAKILMGEQIRVDYGSGGDVDYDFTAPDASVLIVDDNQVNLTVSAGLLEPLEMHIDTAQSGMQAIELVQMKHYDLVFMDHMMPEMDGVETTHVIRRMFPEYNDVPIIALTGNVMDDMRKMFLTEGMNDFVAKPIELRVLIGKVRQWLNPEKIVKSYISNSEDTIKQEKEIIRVGDLDTESAIKMLGSEKLFWTILKDYYSMIDQKSELIKTLADAHDWAGYTIEVHALKSSSRQIGAMKLSNMAAELEKHGNARDKKAILSGTDQMLELYTGYKDVFSPFFKENEDDKMPLKEMDIEDINRLFKDMLSAADELDMDRMEEVVEELLSYRYDDIQSDYARALKEAVHSVDVDTVADIIEKWSILLNV